MPDAGRQESRFLHAAHERLNSASKSGHLWLAAVGQNDHTTIHQVIQVPAHPTSGLHGNFERARRAAGDHAALPYTADMRPAGLNGTISAGRLIGLMSRL